MIKEVTGKDLKDFKLIDNTNPFVKYIGYFDNDKIFGYVEYLFLYDRLEISNIFVKEEYRNRKIGTNMLKYIIEFAKNNNLYNITLEVSINNNYAIMLYESLNFKIVATRKGYYDGVDGILMELII